MRPLRPVSDAIHCVRNRPQQNRATGANGINVRFVNGAGFRLTMDMFSFSNINGGDIPGTDFLISEADGDEGGLRPARRFHFSTRTRDGRNTDL